MIVGWVGASIPYIQSRIVNAIRTSGHRRLNGRELADIVWSSGVQPENPRDCLAREIWLLRKKGYPIGGRSGQEGYWWNGTAEIPVGDEDPGEMTLGMLIRSCARPRIENVDTASSLVAAS